MLKPPLLEPGVATWRVGTNIPPLTTRARQSRGVDRLAPPERRRPNPLLWLSLIVHALILAGLILAPPKPPAEDQGLGPPSVSVILGPSAETPTSPAPTPQAAIGVPRAPSVQRSPAPDAVAVTPPTQAATAPPPAPARAPTPPAVAALTPPPQAATPPPPAPPAPPSAPSALADEAAPPMAVPILPAPPVPPPPALVPPRPAAPPAPPLREALVQPQLTRPPPPSLARPAAPAPPRPFVPRQPAPRTPPASSDFPMPMFSSLGGALGETARRPTAPSRESAGPVKLDSNTAYRPQYDLSGDDLGASWERLFSDWVNRHKYYPRQAAENGEEGTTAVRIVVGHDGKIKSVSLLERSGSQWLDLALEALFRGQRLPPLPEDFSPGDATLNVRMHYILIR